MDTEKLAANGGASYFFLVLRNEGVRVGKDRDGKPQRSVTMTCMGANFWFVLQNGEHSQLDNTRGEWFVVICDAAQFKGAWSPRAIVSCERVMNGKASSPAAAGRAASAA